MYGYFLSITFTGEKVISYASILGLGMYCLDRTVEERCVRRVYLSCSFGDLIFIGSVGGIENAEILAVGGGEENIVTALGEKTDILALGNAQMSNYLTAPLKMRHSLCVIV